MQGCFFGRAECVCSVLRSRYLDLIVDGPPESRNSLRKSTYVVTSVPDDNDAGFVLNELPKSTNQLPQTRLQIDRIGSANVVMNTCIRSSVV